MVSESEFISGVKFDEALGSSPYVKPTRMFFERRGRKVAWDLAFGHDSVAVLLYHKTKKALLLVKQFRPAVFVAKIRKLAENKGKALNEIDWSKYPVSLGETLELCAGIIDKPNCDVAQHAQEEILEECGYSVPLESLELVHSFISGVSLSGSQQHLYFAEIDEKDKVTEGGGNEHEGEMIQKVYLGIDDARALLDKKDTQCPPGLVFAFKWFFDRLSN
uniref:Uridine diphosphate glucose pyrophosphatase NUDT14 n=1 Tax=Steinernema glaseri TaxID=37863 RepID=A0A1I8A501_9BILA